MDPFTIAAAIAFFGGLIVVVLAITVKRIIQWFRAKGRIKTENGHAIAFTLADRINNKKYAEVRGVFEGRPENTRIVQGFFDVERGEIIDARALASSTSPLDQEIIDQHYEGDGLVVYS